jgi:penicillin amidase
MSGEFQIPCLDEEVEVIYDRAGIPHITAKSNADGFRALGYVMAQDRMVQMAVMLRVAKGTLSEIVGSMALEMDRFMRTIGLYGTAKQFETRLDQESKDTLEAFCEGVNDYLARPGVRLPFEFIFLKGRPAPWEPADCLTYGLFVTWLLDAFWPHKLMRENLVRALGLERALELLPQTAEYNNPPVKVKGRGVEVDPIEPGEQIDWGFGSEGGGGEWLSGVKPSSVFGSNNWVLDGSRTTTGKPILCGDPHIQHNAPGVLFLCHLMTPDYNVIGAAFPGIPVIAYGHNGYCGWSATAMCPDVIDLFVETFESADSDRYLYKGEWLYAEVIEEEVKIRFARPKRLKVLITKHGPMIKRKGNKGLALKWVSHDPALDSLGAFLRQNRAKSWDEFNAAMENFVGPAMSQAYADIDGNIGYLAAAKVPRRAKGDGTLPASGSEGECEWVDYIPFEKMPRAFNPKEGFLATANSKIVSEGYPELITKIWEAPYRNGRISELLRTREKFSPEEMSKIHADVFTLPGRRFAETVVRAAEGKKISPAARLAVERFREWNHQARADSPAMTIYFYSWSHLREKLLRHRLGDELFGDYTRSAVTLNLAMENLLERAEEFWLPPGYSSYDEVVLESLEEGISELECIFGTAEQSEWKWGEIHSITCKSLLGLFWPLTRMFNVGPVPCEGEGDTVNAAPAASDCQAQLLARGTMGGSTEMAILPDCTSHAAYGGPVLRMVLDFSDLDNSMAVLDVGQSGHRLSPHYKDHFERWTKVEYLPLPYSRKKILEQADGIMNLVP